MGNGRFQQKTAVGARQVATISQIAPPESVHLPRPFATMTNWFAMRIRARRLDGLLYRFSFDRGQSPRPYRRCG